MMELDWKNLVLTVFLKDWSEEINIAFHLNVRTKDKLLLIDYCPINGNSFSGFFVAKNNFFDVFLIVVQDMELMSNLLRQSITVRLVFFSTIVKS
jgi:hypothetical protein